jgi:hypothetical protein
MGFIRNSGDSIREAKELTRWVEILEPDEMLNMPAIQFKVKYINDSTLLRLSKPFANKKSESVDMNKERKFRSTYLQNAVVDWKGVKNQNLRRLSELFLTNPEVFDQPDDVEWEFDKADVGFIGEYMSTDRFGVVVAESTNLNEFVRQQLENEKKS